MLCNRPISTLPIQHGGATRQSAFIQCD